MIYSYPKFRDHQSVFPKNVSPMFMKLAYGLDVVRFTPRRGQKNFLFPQNIQNGFRGPSSRTCKGVPRSGKQRGRGVKLTTPPPNAEVTNECRHNFTPPLTYLFGTDRHNFPYFCIQVRSFLCSYIFQTK